MAATYPDPVPPKGRVGSLLFARSPAGRRWSVALRAALAFAVPAAIITVLGHPDVAVFVMFGAFAVLYGEGRPYRVRGRVVLAAGSALLAACGVGALIGGLLDAGFGSSLLMVVVVTAIAVVAVFVIDALRLGPPGALFFALVCAGAMKAAETGAAALTLLFCTACGVVAALVVSMAGVLRDRRKPERTAVEAAVRAVDAYVAARDAGAPAIDPRHRAGAAMAEAWAAVYDAGLPSDPREAELLATLQGARRRLAGHAADDDTDDLLVDPLVSFARPGIGFRLGRSLSFSSHAAISALRVAAGCLGAGALSALLGLDRPHWAVLSALIVLQAGPDRVRGQVRAIHRFVGTIAGLGLFALIYQLGPTGYALIVLIAALQFCIELFVPRNYALAVVFITPVALIAGGVATTGGPIGPVLRDRLAETVLGVAVAVLALYGIAPRGHRRTFRWMEHRVRAAAGVLLERLRHKPMDAVAWVLVQHLQFELVGVVRSGIDSATDDPGWTREHWPEHAALAHFGHDLLAACWVLPPGGWLPDVDGWAARAAATRFEPEATAGPPASVRRMHDSVTVRMAAPADEIWALVSDIENTGRFSPETFAAEWLGGATGPAVGAKFRGHVNRNGWGLKYATVCRIVACEPGREFAFTVLGPRGMPINTWRYVFEPVDGGTDVTESFQLHSNLVLRLYWLLAGWTRGKTNVEGMRETLNRIKAVVE
ncbi:FUSC family protein [Nocardia sp. NPDC004573]